MHRRGGWRSAWIGVRRSLLGRRAFRCFGFQSQGFLGRETRGFGLLLDAAFFFLGLTLRVFLGFAARFLGRGEDRNLLLLSPFRFSASGVALLFQQRALARGQFDCRQRAAAWSGLAIGLSGAAGLLL